MKRIMQIDGWVRFRKQNSIGQHMGVEIAPDGMQSRSISGMQQFASRIVAELQNQIWYEVNVKEDK